MPVEVKIYSRTNKVEIKEVEGYDIFGENVVRHTNPLEGVSIRVRRDSLAQAKSAITRNINSKIKEHQKVIEELNSQLNALRAYKG